MSAPKPGRGRFAPSPTGHFHLGNLRTALVAWLCARSQGQEFLLRIEDLDPDRSKPEFEASQLEDLHTLGLGWDSEPVRQSARHAHYMAAFERLAADDLAYRCFCSRRDIAAATEAPHDAPGDPRERPYPGTCSKLSPSAARNRADYGDPFAWRLRAEAATAAFTDLRHGELLGAVDDFILIRHDGTASYHLAVVVDDDAQQISEIVRGDDLLLPTTARHAFLYDALGLRRPTWRHIPLVLDAQGRRLAKREGSLTRSGLLETGYTDRDLLRCLARSLALQDPVDLGTATELVIDFSPEAIPTHAVSLPPGPDPLAEDWTPAAE